MLVFLVTYTYWSRSLEVSIFTPLLTLIRNSHETRRPTQGSRGGSYLGMRAVSDCTY